MFIGMKLLASLLVASFLTFASAEVFLTNYPPANDSTSLAGATPSRAKGFRFTNTGQTRNLVSVKARVRLSATAFTAANFPVIRIHSDTGSTTIPGAAIATLTTTATFAAGTFDYTFTPTTTTTFQPDTTYWLSLAGTNTTAGLDFTASTTAPAWSGVTTVLSNIFTTNGFTSGSASTIRQTWEMITGPQGTNFSGTVTLLNFDPDEVGVEADFDILDANGVVGTANGALLGTGGTFSFSGPQLADGTYTVRAKASHWLRKANTAVVVASGNATGIALSLTNGDVNGDNEVGAADFSALAAAYDAQVGDPNFSANADLNGDAEVGAADFSVLASSYDEVGD